MEGSDCGLFDATIPTFSGKSTENTKRLNQDFLRSVEERIEPRTFQM